jgi:hypothetical protein
MKIEVSDGEIADKHSILCLKLERIPDKQKRVEILREKEILHDYTLSLIVKWPMYYKLLCHVNKIIWDKTNEIKAFCVLDDPVGFAHLASGIFLYNDKRFRLKRIFNTESNIKEQKSYGAKTICIVVPDRQFLLENLGKIICMVLDYDHIQVATRDRCVARTLLEYIPSCCISCDGAETILDDIPSTQDQDALSIINCFIKQAYRIGKQEG